MAALIGVLSLLSALAATGFALSCTQCTSESSSCTGDNVTCPSGWVCGSLYTVTNIGSGESENLVSSCKPSSQCNTMGSITLQGGRISMGTSCCDTDGCTPPLPTCSGESENLVSSCKLSSQCNTMGSITLQGGRISMGTSCCDTDGCTPPLPTLPPISSNPNGLICRSCISTDSTWCYTSDTLQCTGDENMCLLQTTKIPGPVSSSLAFRGCATKSICDIGSQFLSSEDGSSEVKFICTSDGTSVHKVFLTPAIACLLLLKLFF